VEPPDPVQKRQHLLEVFTARGHEVLVESGTFLGDTVAFFLPHAERIVSVEVEPTLYADARRRFAPEPKVELILGDALDVIPQVVQVLDRPPLLWLDGHFSGGVTGRGAEIEPAVTIVERLGRIPTPDGITIVIDDLRLFGSEPTFPQLDELLASARGAFPDGRIYAGLDALVIEG
jgi:hypothetical protein